MPYKAKGKCVYKKNTGEKVGCTKGSVKKYLAALHANVPDAKNESNKNNTMNNPKVDAIITALADKTKNWKDSEGLYEPEDITYAEFISFVVDDPKTGPAIKKFWYSLDTAKQNQIFNRVIDKLYAMSENVKFSRIAKKIMESNSRNTIMLNGKEVEYGSIEVDGVDPRDYPDFADAYISAANFIDGTPLTDEEVQQLDSENYGLANDLAHNTYLQEGEEEEFRRGGKMDWQYREWEREQERMKVCPKCHKKYIAPEYGKDECPRCRDAEKGNG